MRRERLFGSKLRNQAHLGFLLFFLFLLYFPFFLFEFPILNLNLTKYKLQNLYLPIKCRNKENPSIMHSFIFFEYVFRREYASQLKLLFPKIVKEYIITMRLYIYI